jgi:hypothetical protein
MDRRTIILDGIDKPGTRGVEIGPFFSPIAPKRDGWNTVVIDFRDGDSLRTQARKHPSEAIRAIAGNIEDVDVVWQGRPIHEAVAEKFGGEMDYVIGSHSIEHMVDLLGFFKSAGELLRTGGVLALAVPDLRYTFDFFRNPSTIGQVLAVHRRGDHRHAPETLFETIAHSINVDGVGCWMPGTYTPQVNLAATLDHAWKCYQDDLGREQYIDCHAWYFTPSSFQLLVYELHHIGQIELQVKNLTTAADHTTGSEFIVQLEKRQRGVPAPRADVERIRKQLLLQTIAELSERAVNLGMATFRLSTGLRAVG